jgi:hypothetical protein
MYGSKSPFTCCSVTFATADIILIGLQLPGIDLSPFLGTGVINEDFHASGTVHSRIDRFINIAMAGASDHEQFLSRIGLMLS